MSHPSHDHDSPSRRRSSDSEEDDDEERPGPSSSRRGGGGGGEASIPLLGRPTSPGPRDTRFAISEDDVDDGDGDGRDTAASIHKYPPSSQPPSYLDAIYPSSSSGSGSGSRRRDYVQDPWYKSEVALSMHHYSRICFAGLATFFRRYWPTSRFAQAGFFIVGLWIIVIVTGPTWDKSANLGWAKNVDDFLASIPPPPISGDGHLTALADWSMPTCRSTPNGLATYCSRKSSFHLPIPHAKDSFLSSDKIFVFIDPPRTQGLSEGRGKVPASVQVKMDGELRGETRVEIEAFYEKRLEALLQRANVGAMQAGLRDRGVGIYTWPLSPRLEEIYKLGYDYPFLSFRVTVHVQPESIIPNFRIEGADVDVGVFTSAHQAATGKHFALEAGEDKKQGRDVGGDALASGVRSRIGKFRLGHAAGRARAENKQQQQREEQRRQALVSLTSSAASTSDSSTDASANSSTPNPHPFFGSMRITNEAGTLNLGGSVRTMGRLWLETRSSAISVLPGAHVAGHEVHLEAHSGPLSVGDEASVLAKDQLLLLSRGGAVSVGKNVTLSGTRVNGEAGTGLSSGEGSLWASNHTLLLRSGSGPLTASLGVSPPDVRLLGLGTEQRPYVSVEASAEQGDVDVQVAEHVRNTPLRADVKARKGNAVLALNKEYFGAWSIQGGKGSVVTPPREGIVDEEGGRRRVYEMREGRRAVQAQASEGVPRRRATEPKAPAQQGHFDYTAHGEVYWRENGKEPPHHAASSSGGAAAADDGKWGDVSVSAGGGAMARLGFDAVGREAQRQEGDTGARGRT